MFIITHDQTVIELGQTQFAADAFTSETYDLGWSVPAHPVASGVEKSLGVFKNAPTLQLSGCVGRTAFDKGGNDIFAGALDRTIAACELIEQMGDAGDCVTISLGGGKIYTDMVLTAAPIRFERGGRMSFDLAFQKVITFSISETFNAALGQEVHIGEVTTEEAEPQTPPMAQSVPPLSDEEIQELNSETEARILSECEGICGNAFSECLNNCYGGQSDIFPPGRPLLL